ncbi:unnamed protein product [Euphydryas editha]|uniref:Uncharacterized protein n=1 Tax=Euphydryas editha TaxID=104508 RepID=A0AAU9TQZ3_EUPED|nr:unnamed protein product [Euphydryas editha]
MIWVFFLLSLALADKLDRTYLPPPGFKLSGGSPGAIQVPKLQYSSGKDEYFTSPEIAVGINRVAPIRPAGTFSSINNPSIDSENTFTSSTTINPYALNQNVPSINEYSTSRPIDYTSKYTDDFQNSGNSEYFYHRELQDENPSISVANQFPTTENYPQLIQNIPVSDISRNDYTNRYFNQSEPDGELDSIIATNFKSTPSPQLVTDFTSNQFGSGEYSSTPTTKANSNIISSTFSPSTINYDYSSTLGPNQFYSSTLKPPQVSTTNPIDSKYSLAPNYAKVKNRPGRVQAQADREASILNYESSITPEGYSYSYDTSNGIHADETGVTVNGVKAKGSYSYIGDDGKFYNVVYTADEYGFQPKGEHLPTPPPIPEAILKVIEQVTKEKEAGIIDDGSYDENKYGYRRYHNGFYSPKSDISKQHSILGDKLIKNVKNVISNNNNKNRQSTIPVINNYSNMDNIGNIDSQVLQQPYLFNNESIIRNIEPYNIINLESGGNTDKKLINKSFKQVYNNPIVENESKPLLGAQTALDESMVNYNSFAEKDNEQNKLFKYSKEPFSTETGYQYNSPQYKEKIKFPTRFFDVHNERNEMPKQDTSNKVTPRPFQTPYVSRTDEKIQGYDNYEKSFEDSDEHYDKELPENSNKYKLDSVVDINGKTDTFGVRHDNSSIHKTYPIEEHKVDNSLQTVTDGYTYQQGILNKKSFNPFVGDPHLHTSSNIVPPDFTSRITMIQSTEPNFNIGNTQTSRGSESNKYTPNVYQTNLQFDKTNKKPDFSNIRPGFMKQTGLEDTNLNMDFSTTIPILKSSYAPNLDINHSDEYNVQPTRENIIGEDFTGPKQQQRFDPLTGYHY